MTNKNEKAKRAYDAARRVRPAFAGTMLPPWERIDLELRAAWVAKVVDVEANPKRWLESDDPTCVAVALAVIGPFTVGGSC